MEAAACFLCEWLRWRSRPLTPEEAADFIDLCANRDNQNLKERGGDIDNQQVNQGRYAVLCSYALSRSCYITTGHSRHSTGSEHYTEREREKR